MTVTGAHFLFLLFNSTIAFNYYNYLYDTEVLQLRL